MAILGIVTNEGLEAAKSSNNFAGWDLKPFRIAVSDVASAIVPERTIATQNPPWYAGNPKSIMPIDENTLEIFFEIPEGFPSAGEKTVAEIYVTCLDNQGAQRLFSVGQVVDTQPIVKKSGDHVECSVVISLKPYEDVDAIRIAYNYDIGFSTTSAVDIMNLLEAGANVKLSFERTQVRIDINAPWDLSIEGVIGEAVWETITTRLEQIEPNERVMVDVDTLLSSYGGGIGIRLIIATLDGSGNETDSITLDRRDYQDAIASEPIKFQQLLQGDAESSRDVEFQLQIRKLVNTEFDMTNPTINFYREDN